MERCLGGLLLTSLLEYVPIHDFVSVTNDNEEAQ